MFALPAVIVPDAAEAERTQRLLHAQDVVHDAALVVGLQEEHMMYMNVGA